MSNNVVATIDLNITIDRVIKVQADQPEAAEENVKRLIDLLIDLQQLLSRHS